MMNRQVSRLALTALALMIALIVGTTYWQTWAQAGLADRQDNEIQRVAKFTIKRGLIYAGDGKTVLAANRAKRVGNQTLYFRRYPQGKLAPHVVGYSTQTRSQAGIERSLDDYLTGSNANLNTVFKTALERLRGVTPQDVRRVANTYMRNFQFIVLGNPQKIDKQIFQRQPAFGR